MSAGIIIGVGGVLFLVGIPLGIWLRRLTWFDGDGEER